MRNVQRCLALAGLGLLAGAVPAGAAEEQAAAEVIVTRYAPGDGDDLLTAGLGATGLASVTPPTVADVTDPAQLRRRTIYTNYRALVDTSAGGGFGTLYGPAVGKPAAAGPDGQIYGTEYLTFASYGRRKVTMMVQVPDFFARDGRPPCIVTGPSSGSRGIYGAIGTSGEWGLKKGCAVAYTDKGTGIGAHDLAADTVTTLRGVRLPADEAGRRSNFTAEISERQRRAFDAAYPDRWAWKHAHSQDNPEARWDEDVLDAIDFAFAVLNRAHGGRDHDGRSHRYTPANTLVVASSVSNGGAASLRAAETARRGLIDGVVVSEPNVNPRFDPRFGIRQPDGSVLWRHSRPLYDYASIIDLYQGCANKPYLADPSLPLILGTIVPNDATSADARCAALKEAGLLKGADPAGWPREAQDRLNGYGLLTAQNVLAPSYWSFYVVQAVTLTYANAYARASVLDNLCGFSFAAASLAVPAPTSLPTNDAGILFATGNGIPPTGGVATINNLAPGGAAYDPGSSSSTTSGRDQNTVGAACLRSLWPAQPQARDGRKTSRTDRLRAVASIGQILARGRLHGTPTIILHGRDDALIAPNHSSRAYYGLNLLQDGRTSPTRYYEVVNAQHLDAFNSLPGYSTRYIPLHYYFVQALDLMWAHLTQGRALPPSQVVRTVPRAAATDTVTSANVPPIATSPATGNAITFVRRVLDVPS